MEVSGSRGVGGDALGAGASASRLLGPLLPASPRSRSRDRITEPAVVRRGETSRTSGGEPSSQIPELRGGLEMFPSPRRVSVSVPDLQGDAIHSQRALA